MLLIRVCNGRNHFFRQLWHSNTLQSHRWQSLLSSLCRLPTKTRSMLRMFCMAGFRSLLILRALVGMLNKSPFQVKHKTNQAVGTVVLPRLAQRVNNLSASWSTTSNTQMKYSNSYKSYFPNDEWKKAAEKDRNVRSEVDSLAERVRATDTM